MDDNRPEELGPDYITIVDEEGKSYEMELLDSVELDGKSYMAFCEADLPEDEEAVEVTIFRVMASEDGEELVSIEDDDEMERVYTAFLEQAYENEEDGE